MESFDDDARATLADQLYSGECAPADGSIIICADEASAELIAELSRYLIRLN